MCARVCVCVCVRARARVSVRVGLHVQTQTHAQVKEMFLKYDVDGDNAISFDEFIEMTHSLGIAPRTKTGTPPPTRSPHTACRTPLTTHHTPRTTHHAPHTTHHRLRVSCHTIPAYYDPQPTSMCRLNIHRFPFFLYVSCVSVVLFHSVFVQFPYFYYFPLSGCFDSSRMLF